MHRCPGHGPWPEDIPPETRGQCSVTCVPRRTNPEACGTLEQEAPQPHQQRLLKAVGRGWGLGNLGLEEGRVVQAGEGPLACWNPEFDVARRMAFKLILDCSPQ